VVNASVSGETTSGALARLPKLLQTYKPEVVVIELGGMMAYVVNHHK
jgi:acyl-CoA thioesterase-1